MKAFRSVLLGVALALLLVPSVRAQDAPATGFSIWTRILETNSVDLLGAALGGSTSSSTSPTFVVGYQSNGFALGLAAGYSRLSLTDKSSSTEDKVTGTIWQIGPSALIHFWQAPGGMTRANVVVEVTFGQASASNKFTSGGTTTEQKASGDVFGGRLGVGGDHFFGGHFAVGAEVGLEGTMLSGLQADGSTDSIDASSYGAYGALRATVVF
jgi:hypothetical protein